jgi:hypothetical protein
VRCARASAHGSLLRCAGARTADLRHDLRLHRGDARSERGARRLALREELRHRFQRGSVLHLEHLC